MAGYDFKDEEQVKEYLKNLYTEYQFGCYSEKKPEVCHLLGDYYESIKKNFKEAASIYQKNCDNLNYDRSCAKFGGWKLLGKGCKKDLVEAFKYMKKGCDLGDSAGCTNAGIVAIANTNTLKDDKESVMQLGMKMLKKACIEMKADRACYFLTGIYVKGIPGLIEPNNLEAYKYSLQSCEFGNPYACMHLSRMHEEGDGVEKNQKLADTFKRRSRELHNEIKQYQQGLQFGQGIEP